MLLALSRHLLPLLALAGALIPAAYKYWSSRTLRVDDPVLPERLLAHRMRCTQVLGVTCGLLIFLAAGHAVWSIPVAVLASLAATLPSRRRLFGETWSLPDYLAWTTRVGVALWGYWPLLMAAPALVYLSGAWAFTTAGSLAVVLGAWSLWYARVLLWLTGARPFDAHEWPDGFERVLEQARVSRPRLWRIGPPGAQVANAVAIPAFGVGSVLFTDALLERLQPDEQEAILAHEVSHLELFDRSLLLRWQLTSAALIIGSVLLSPLVQAAAPAVVRVAIAGWPLVVLLHLVHRGRDIRAQETPSDIRAVELAGNPDALVRGLVTLHERARLPRRWAAAFERQATHPSLARRIQAIRSAAGLPNESQPASLPIVIRGHEDGSAVILDADVVRHLTGVPADTAIDVLLQRASSTVAVPYASISELRVDAAGTRAPRLVLADANGRTWFTALAVDDVVAVQASLDAVDSRLAAHVLPRSTDRLRARLATALLAIFAALAAAATSIAAGSVALVAALACLWPSPAAILAAGIAGVAGAAFCVSGTSATACVLVGVVLAATGGAAIWHARRWRATACAAVSRFHAIVALSAAALWAAAILWTGGNLIALHKCAMQVPALTILPLALGAACFWSGDARLKRGTAAALMLALTASLWTMPVVVAAVVIDPLNAAAPIMRPLPSELQTLARAAAPAGASVLRLSPAGSWFATRPDDEENSEPTVFTVGDMAGGHSATLEVDDLEFLDERTVVSLASVGPSTIVSAHAVDDLVHPYWRVVLPSRDAAGIWVDRRTRAWHAIDTSADRRHVRRFEGRVGDTAFATHTWEVPAGEYVQWRAGANAEPLGEAYVGETRRPALARWLAPLDLPWHFSLTLRSTALNAGTVRSQLAGDCHEATPGGRVLCVARDGSRSRLWTWDARGLQPLAIIDGDVQLETNDPGGWWTAWRSGRLLLVQPQEARGYDLKSCVGRRCLGAPVYTGHVLGAIVAAPERTEVVTYRIRASMP
jgi:Zn-dependent protease with chaperone function